jgi:hypothetical protein
MIILVVQSKGNLPPDNHDTDDRTFVGTQSRNDTSHPVVGQMDGDVEIYKRSYQSTNN